MTAGRGAIAFSERPCIGPRRLGKRAASPVGTSPPDRSRDSNADGRPRLTTDEPEASHGTTIVLAPRRKRRQRLKSRRSARPAVEEVGQRAPGHRKQRRQQVSGTGVAQLGLAGERRRARWLKVPSMPKRTYKPTRNKTKLARRKAHQEAELLGPLRQVEPDSVRVDGSARAGRDQAYASGQARSFILHGARWLPTSGTKIPPDCS